MMLALAVLVPLINMPFDWLSIGITRALLRRGCEADGALFWLALLDLFLGLMILVLLAGALVLGLRLADAAIVSSGRKMLIDVDRQIARIAAAPGDPANYWIYATLFSTLIPSLLNVLIGAVSLGTWLCRPLRRWMLETIPLLETKGDGTRWKLVNAFGAQVFVSVFLAGFMLWGVGYVAVQNRALVGHGYVYVADVIDRHAPW